jgi:hypothetical protein
MFVALALVVVVVLIVLPRRRSQGNSSVRHVTETEEGGGEVINAQSAPGQAPARLLSDVVAGVIAIGTMLR